MTSQLQLTDRVLTIDIEKKTIDWGERRMILDEGGLVGWYGGAEVLRNNRQRLGSHGIFSERGWRGAALVTVSGWIETDTRALAAQAVDDLSEFLADGVDGRIIVRDVDHGGRFAVCYLNNAPDIEWLAGPHERIHVKFTYDLVCTDPRHYEEEPVTASTGLAQPGGGLRFPLFARGEPEVLRTNLVTNPGAEVDTSWWTGQSSTVTQDSAWAASGSKSFRISAGGTTSSDMRAGNANLFPFGMQAGRTYTLSATMRLAAPMLQATNDRVRRVSILYSTNGSTYTFAYGTQGSNVAGEFRSVATVTIPENATGAMLMLGHGSVNAADVTWWDSILLEETSETRTFFDGSTLDTITEAYRWTGDTNNSTSEAVTPIVPSSGVLDFGILGDDGLATLTNHGNADTTVLVSVKGPAPQGFTATEISTGRRLVYTGTLGAADYVDLDSSDGTVLLNGYADRGSLLTVRDWFLLDKRTTSSYKIEAPSGSPTMTVSASPAWW